MAISLEYHFYMLLSGFYTLSVFSCSLLLPKNKTQKGSFMEFNENLKSARKKAGLKQGQLAEIIGVTQKDISRWENGVYSPGTDMLIRLCKALDVSADTLLGINKNE